MLTVEKIRNILTDHKPQLSTPADGKHASVALILRDGKQGLEVLFIRRAEHDDDPWSGDIAFPGGRVELSDKNPREAAERETLEEINLDLAAAKYLGQIGDIHGAYLPVRISCFVYWLEETPELILNYEVVDAFWVSLPTLLDPGRNRQQLFSYRGEQRNHPIIDLNGFSERFLWGISYRLLQRFLSLVNPD
ncbi:MAG TPA: CoA pyrophosphatase [Geopsychrobacteraceae bacterium]|nr:CoA pyrophosphatase [Geopsychrobacteraceae bacterium]